MSVGDGLSLALSEDCCVLPRLEGPSLLLRQILPLEELLFDLEDPQACCCLLVSYTRHEPLIDRIITERVFSVTGWLEGLVQFHNLFLIDCAVAEFRGQHAWVISHVLVDSVAGEQGDVSVVVMVGCQVGGAHRRAAVLWMVIDL